MGLDAGYLEKIFSQVTLQNGTNGWASSSYWYIKNVVNNVEYYLHKKGGNIPDSTKFPCYVNYRQETDVSPEILSTNVNYFQSYNNESQELS